MSSFLPWCSLPQAAAGRCFFFDILTPWIYKAPVTRQAGIVCLFFNTAIQVTYPLESQLTSFELITLLQPSFIRTLLQHTTATIFATQDAQRHPLFARPRCFSQH